MGCFSGRLMSAASNQKLFCKLCSPFCCSFDEFVEEKVISPSYSSAILTPPISDFYRNLSPRERRENFALKWKQILSWMRWGRFPGIYNNNFLKCKQMAPDFITLWILNESIQKNKSLYFSSGFYLFFYRIAIQSFFNPSFWQSLLRKLWVGKTIKLWIFSAQCHLLSTWKNFTHSKLFLISTIFLVSILALPLWDDYPE